ncbi:transcriptional regulator, partial [Streptomyces sp. 12257]|nr:transcriptional regulator [Streptomyces sp. 12257]
MDSDNRLGLFLRARRALVRPEDAGLPAGSRRR